jgi:hypothetical protein
MLLQVPCSNSEPSRYLGVASLRAWRPPWSTRARRARLCRNSFSRLQLPDLPGALGRVLLGDLPRIRSQPQNTNGHRSGRVALWAP